MKINPPTKNVFYISLVIAILSVVAFFVPSFKEYAFFVALVAYVLLFLGNTLKGF